MTFFDVIINDNDISHLLEKTTFTIQSSKNFNKIDLRSQITDNFELLGSIANSIASLIEFDLKKKVSRMFLYYNERLDTDTYNLNDAIRSFMKYGYCLYEDYEYNPELLNERPSNDIYKKAEENKYKFDVVKIKKDLNSLILALINNEPFIVSIKIYEGFDINSNEISLPQLNETNVGAISIVICGFNDERQVFIAKLLNRYYELPYFYLIKEGLSSACYIFIYRTFDIQIPIIQEPLSKPPLETPKILKKVDLRNKFPDAYDQGKIGSCSANALCSIFDYDTINFKGSRLFLYYNERALINETNEDNGAYLSDGIYSLKSNGICEEKYWEYKLENLFKRPPDDIYQKAKENYLIEAFNISNDLLTIKKWIDNNEPIALAISIFSNFMSINTKITGKVGMPSKNDKFLGGHAVVICGYDDNSQELILRNSWGTYWGERGYFYLPYDYLKFCGDLWIITKSKFNNS